MFQEYPGIDPLLNPLPGHISRGDSHLLTRRDLLEKSLEGSHAL